MCSDFASEKISEISVVKDSSSEDQVACQKSLDLIGEFLNYFFYFVENSPMKAGGFLGLKNLLFIDRVYFVKADNITVRKRVLHFCLEPCVAIENIISQLCYCCLGNHVSFLSDKILS